MVIAECAVQSSPMANWAGWLNLGRPVLRTSARTALAAVVSLLLARALGLPEFYWAPISTIVILLSTIDPLTLAWQRFAGTALGAVLGAIIASSVPRNGIIFGWMIYGWIVYGLGIFLCGVFSAVMRLGGAYRFAAITLTIVLLIVHSRPPSVVALHRFIEVSLGIAVALAVTFVWRVPAD